MVPSRCLDAPCLMPSPFLNFLAPAHENHPPHSPTSLHGPSGPRRVERGPKTHVYESRRFAMACVIKHVIRTSVIGGLVLGAAVAIAGPDRIGALFHQTRDVINRKIDKNITDPLALRIHLRDLRAQYPQRIADVKGHLAELREREGQSTRETG